MKLSLSLALALLAISQSAFARKPNCDSVSQCKELKRTMYDDGCGTSSECMVLSMEFDKRIAELSTAKPPAPKDTDGQYACNLHCGCILGEYGCDPSRSYSEYTQVYLPRDPRYYVFPADYDRYSVIVSNPVVARGDTLIEAIKDGWSQCAVASQVLFTSYYKKYAPLTIETDGKEVMALNGPNRPLLDLNVLHTAFDRVVVSDPQDPVESKYCSRVVR